MNADQSVAPIPLLTRWLGDPSRASSLAAWFCENVGDEYISHGELEGGRAQPDLTWRADLAVVMASEIRRALSSGNQVGVALASSEEQLMVEFLTHPEGPLARLHDFVVKRGMRDSGVGTRMLDWLEDECGKRGARVLLLESASGNVPAHRFFERRGYTIISVSMIKHLDAVGSQDSRKGDVAGG